MKAVLTIAGSDSSGGAGIQADIKTIAAHRLYAESVVTALTAQNTCAVFGVQNVDPDFIKQQLDAVFQDIRPDAVKIGMVSSCEAVCAVAEALDENKAENIVVDPVMVATSGSKLTSGDAVRALVEKLFPIAAVITPNLAEAEVLSGVEIENEDDMVQAAHIIAKDLSYDACATANAPIGVCGCQRLLGYEGAKMPSGAHEGDAGLCVNRAISKAAVLVKGGHMTSAPGCANDFLLTRGSGGIWLYGKRLQNPNTHGTGCTLSSAIACGLALGQEVEVACRSAKEYVAGAIAANLNMGKGSGPVNHMWEYVA